VSGGYELASELGHILFVDDDEAFCYAAAKALSSGGFDVTLAPDHRIALQILEGPQPLDLLITDLVMPGGINGFALARMARMRRLDLRVLYLTAYELPMGEAVGKILRKPIDLDVLVSEVRLVLTAPSIRQPSSLSQSVECALRWRQGHTAFGNTTCLPATAPTPMWRTPTSLPSRSRASCGAYGAQALSRPLLPAFAHR